MGPPVAGSRIQWAYGVLAVARGHRQLFISDPADVLRAAFKGGHIGTVEWTRATLMDSDPSVVDPLVVVAAELELIRCTDAARRIRALDWWWTTVDDYNHRYLHHHLLSPERVADITDVALASGDMALIVWWWAKMPAFVPEEHHDRYTFGTRHAVDMAFRNGSVAVIQWLWDDSHASPHVVPVRLDIGTRVRRDPGRLYVCRRRCARMVGRETGCSQQPPNSSGMDAPAPSPRRRNPMPGRA
ncbi:hypothetical protein BC828DRAFT_208392 [Blastocladiella britannica]|nr:hypothetical protein BC828DRAFT_208392 [Blastocladiella britannica]